MLAKPLCQQLLMNLVLWLPYGGAADVLRAVIQEHVDGAAGGGTYGRKEQAEPPQVKIEVQVVVRIHLERLGVPAQVSAGVGSYCHLTGQPMWRGREQPTLHTPNSSDSYRRKMTKG